MTVLNDSHLTHFKSFSFEMSLLERGLVCPKEPPRSTQSTQSA